MKRGAFLQLAAGLLLLLSGVFLAVRNSLPAREQAFRGSGCTMSVHIYEPGAQPLRGGVFVVHGLASNSKLMDYYTRGFLALGLRVMVPDLPGHGASPGPFTPSGAESCAQALFTHLVRTGDITPEKTVLAGHSLGGALAVRLASQIRLAGVIAISPAPMLPAADVSPEMVLYPSPPKLPLHSLFLTGGLEPSSMRLASQRLFAQKADPSGAYRLVPAATHTSLLFDAQALRFSLDWAASQLALPRLAALPPRNFSLGFLFGLCGLLFLSGPLLRAALHLLPSPSDVSATPSFFVYRPIVEIAAASAFAAGLLRFGVPLRAIGLLNGDYLTSFLLIVGAAILIAHPARFRPFLRLSRQTFPSALFLGLATSVLFFVWFHFTLTTATLDAARLRRLPWLVLALFPYCAAEELLLPAHAATGRRQRLLQGLFLRFLTWLALTGALFFLHSGQVLLVLLAPYLALFNLAHRAAMDLFRQETRSAAGTAFFGAILAGVFCVLVFPLT